ncbi:MAG: hypothetical protein HY586_05005 [Candidatus Omnitrophica bacterium]|nr:hypothetical protein [Candidatus Omnitrophota bacterium]
MFPAAAIFLPNELWEELEEKLIVRLAEKKTSKHFAEVESSAEPAAGETASVFPPAALPSELASLVPASFQSFQPSGKTSPYLNGVFVGIMIAILSLLFAVTAGHYWTEYEKTQLPADESVSGESDPQTPAEARSLGEAGAPVFVPWLNVPLSQGAWLLLVYAEENGLLRDLSQEEILIVTLRRQGFSWGKIARQLSMNEHAVRDSFRRLLILLKTKLKSKIQELRPSLLKFLKGRKQFSDIEASQFLDQIFSNQTLIGSKLTIAEQLLIEYVRQKDPDLAVLSDFERQILNTEGRKSRNKVDRNTGRRIYGVGMGRVGVGIKGILKKLRENIDLPMAQDFLEQRLGTRDTTQIVTALLEVFKLDHDRVLKVFQPTQSKLLQPAPVSEEDFLAVRISRGTYKQFLDLLRAIAGETQVRNRLMHNTEPRKRIGRVIQKLLEPSERAIAIAILKYLPEKKSDVEIDDLFEMSKEVHIAPDRLEKFLRHFVQLYISMRWRLSNVSLRASSSLKQIVGRVEEGKGKGKGKGEARSLGRDEIPLLERIENPASEKVPEQLLAYLVEKLNQTRETWGHRIIRGQVLRFGENLYFRFEDALLGWVGVDENPISLRFIAPEIWRKLEGELVRELNKKREEKLARLNQEIDQTQTSIQEFWRSLKREDKFVFTFLFFILCLTAHAVVMDILNQKTELPGTPATDGITPADAPIPQSSSQAQSLGSPADSSLGMPNQGKPARLVLRPMSLDELLIEPSSINEQDRLAYERLMRLAFSMMPHHPDHAKKLKKIRSAPDSMIWYIEKIWTHFEPSKQKMLHQVWDFMRENERIEDLEEWARSRQIDYLECSQALKALGHRLMAKSLGSEASEKEARPLTPRYPVDLGLMARSFKKRELTYANERVLACLLAEMRTHFSKPNFDFSNIIYVFKRQAELRRLLDWIEQVLSLNPSLARPKDREFFDFLITPSSLSAVISSASSTHRSILPTPDREYFALEEQMQKKKYLWLALLSIFTLLHGVFMQRHLILFSGVFLACSFIAIQKHNHFLLKMTDSHREVVRKKAASIVKNYYSSRSEGRSLGSAVTHEQKIEKTLSGLICANPLVQLHAQSPELIEISAGADPLLRRFVLERQTRGVGDVRGMLPVVFDVTGKLAAREDSLLAEWLTNEVTVTQVTATSDGASCAALEKFLLQSQSRRLIRIRV